MHGLIPKGAPVDLGMLASPMGATVSADDEGEPICFGEES